MEEAPRHNVFRTVHHQQSFCCDFVVVVEDVSHTDPRDAHDSADESIADVQYHPVNMVLCPYAEHQKTNPYH